MAHGRLVLEGGRARRELVCECGQVLAFLGYEEYGPELAAAVAAGAIVGGVLASGV